MEPFNLHRSLSTLCLCITCGLKVSVSDSSCKLSARQDIGMFSSQPEAVESSSDDHGSPPADSQMSSCAVSRRTSIVPHVRPAADDVSTSESNENSIVRAKQTCGAELLNFEHLKMQLDKLTGQNKEKQRQTDAENVNSTISPSPSCASLSFPTATANLPYVGSWPVGLDRTPSIEADVSLLPADGVSSVRSTSSVAADSTVALLCNCSVVEQKLPTPDPVCAASSVALTQGDLISSVVGGQQLRPESSVSSHHHQHHHHHNHHHQHVASSHDPLTQLSAASIWPPAAQPQLRNADTTLSAFRQPGYFSEHIPTAEWHQPMLMQQMQQQSLMMAQQMHAHHPALTQFQKMLHLQQQLQQHQQAIQLMHSALLQSQYKPDVIQQAFGSPAPTAAGLPLQNVQLTNLLIESGLSPGKAVEVVQQLQHILMPTSYCSVQVPGASVLQTLTNSGCSVDPLSQIHNQLLLSQFPPAGGLSPSLLTSWYNVQFAYAQVMQLLARPNPLITPELLESMLAQLPPPLNLNASNVLNPRVALESLYTKFLEFLAMQVGEPPVPPVQSSPSLSLHGFSCTSTSAKDDSSSIYVNRSVAAATVQSVVSSAEDKLGPIVSSKQPETPVKARRSSYAGVDGCNAVAVTQSCPLHRGGSVDSECGDVPGAKVPTVPRSTTSCFRHPNVPIGNGAKVTGSAVPKKNVDCPQGLADLDMALKEKLRPRTIKGVGSTVSDHPKTSVATVVSNGAVYSVSSAPQSAAAVTCDLERSCVTNANAAITSQNTSSIVYDTSALPKLPNTSVSKSTALAVNEKMDAAKKMQVPTALENICKAGDVAALEHSANAAALSSVRTVSAVLGNIHQPEFSMDIAKPANSSMCISVAAGSVSLGSAAKSLMQCRECATAAGTVSLPVLSLANSDINRQHVSDSAIAATTTQLAQKHLHKKVTDHENVSAADVIYRQSHSVISVSCALCSSEIFDVLLCFYLLAVNCFFNCVLGTFFLFYSYVVKPHYLFVALTLLAGWQEGQLACKKSSTSKGSSLEDLWETPPSCGKMGWLNQSQKKSKP